MGGQVEDQDVDTQEQDADHLGLKGAVIDVLIRDGHEEHRARCHVDQKSKDSPPDETMHGPWRQALGQSQQAQIEQPNRTDQKSESQEVKALTDRPGKIRVNHEIGQPRALERGLEGIQKRLHRITSISN